MTCVCGIDPGLKGALAFYFPEHDRVSVEDMPVLDGEVDVRLLWHRIDQMRPDIAIVERVGPRPKEAPNSAFTFGGTYMAAKATVRLYGVPMHLVTPQTWKKHFRLPGGPDGKAKARSLASDLWPSVSSYFCRVKDDGRAEAALLALFASRTISNGLAQAGGATEGEASASPSFPLIPKIAAE